MRDIEALEKQLGQPLRPLIRREATDRCPGASEFVDLLSQNEGLEGGALADKLWTGILRPKVHPRILVFVLTDVPPAC